MTQWEQVRRQVAVVGRVTDAASGRALPGVRVAITAAPAAFTGWLAGHALQAGAAWATLDQRLDRVRTQADGRFHFLDLPNGQYTLSASWPEQGGRYGSASGQITIARTSGGRITLAALELALPATALSGQITGRNNAPVALAEVRLKGRGVTTRSDDQGRYLLTALEPGNHTVIVSAQGYASKETAITSQASQAQTLNIAL